MTLQPETPVLTEDINATSRPACADTESKEPTQDQHPIPAMRECRVPARPPDHPARNRTRAFLQLDVQGDQIDMIPPLLAHCPAVEECYATDGEWFYLLKICVSDMAELEKVARSMWHLPGVAAVKTTLVLSAILQKDRQAG